MDDSTRDAIFLSIFLVVIFGVFAIVSPHSYDGAKEIFTSYRSENWTKVEATILNRGWESCARSRRRGYSIESVPYITYWYKVQGNLYHSNRYNWSNGSHPCKGAGIQKVYEQLATRKFIVGSKLVAYVNPNNPAESVLNHDLNWGLFRWLGWIATTLISLGSASTLALMSYGAILLNKETNRTSEDIGAADK